MIAITSSKHVPWPITAPATILSRCSICSCGNPFGYLVFQRFHRASIAWNYSRKEEDWCRTVLSMSDGSSAGPGNLLRIYKSLMAILGPYVYVGPKAAVVMCFLPNVNIFKF